MTKKPNKKQMFVYFRYIVLHIFISCDYSIFLILQEKFPEGYLIISKYRGGDMFLVK